MEPRQTLRLGKARACWPCSLQSQAQYRLSPYRTPRLSRRLISSLRHARAEHPWPGRRELPRGTFTRLRCHFWKVACRSRSNPTALIPAKPPATKKLRESVDRPTPPFPPLRTIILQPMVNFPFASADCSVRRSRSSPLRLTAVKTSESDLLGLLVHLAGSGDSLPAAGSEGGEFGLPQGGTNRHGGGKLGGFPRVSGLADMAGASLDPSS